MIAACVPALLGLLLPAQVAPLNEDLQILAPWREALSSAQTTGRVVNTGVIGDSITTKRDTWVFWLRNHLWNHFGNAGEGSFDVHPSSTGDDSGGYVWAPIIVTSWGVSGSWSRTYDDTSPTHPLFVTGNWAACNHSGGGWRIVLHGADATLRYIEEPGAGTITASIADEIVLTVDADALEQASRSVEVPLPNGLDTYVIDLESTAPPAEPQPVKLDLIDVRTGLPGSVLHRWGQGGKPCSYFLAKNEQTYQDLLDTVEPDVLWIQCDPAYETMDEYDADLRALVARFQNLRPGMPIVLISHHRFSNGHAAPTLVMYDVAADDPSVGFVNVFDLHEEKADIVTLGYLADDVHLTAKGGKFYAAWILREMLGWPRADLDLDGVVGQADLGDLLGAYGSAIGDDNFVDLADITRDGLVDQADLGAMLGDYGWSAR